MINDNSCGSTITRARQRHLGNSSISEYYFVTAKKRDKTVVSSFDVMNGYWTAGLQSRLWKSITWAIYHCGALWSHHR